MGVLVISKQEQVIEANPAYKTITGIEDAAARQDLAVQCLDVKAPALLAALRTALTQGRTTILEETPFRHNSQTRFLDARCSPLRDKRGDIIGAIASLQDITELTELKTMIQYLQEYNDRIIDSSPAGILVTDTMGIITKINAAHERISGRPKEEILGRILYKNYAPNASKAVRDGFRDVIATGKARSFRYQLYPSTRKGIQYFHIRLGPLKDDRNNTIGVVQVIDDVTKEVTLQRELHQYAKNLDEKVAELHTSYIEVGKVNRQLASVIDIENLMPDREDRSLDSVYQIIEAITMILGGEFACFRLEDSSARGQTHLLLHGKNKLIRRSDPGLAKLPAYISLAQSRGLPFQVVNLTKEESSGIQLQHLTQPIISISYFPIHQESGVLICFTKRAEFSNLDIDLSKTFIKRISQLLQETHTLEK